MKSYIFRVVVEDDEHEDGRPAFRAYCPTLESIGASTCIDEFWTLSFFADSLSGRFERHTAFWAVAGSVPDDLGAPVAIHCLNHAFQSDNILLPRR